MAGTFQPPPTWALPVIVDEHSGKSIFNPIWLRWFLDLVKNLGTSGAGSVSAITAGTGLTGGTISTSGTIALATVGTAGTYTKTTFNATGQETSGAAAVLASADYATQGGANTVLHGGGAGNPSWSAVDLAVDVTGALPIAALNGGIAGSTVIVTAALTALGAQGSMTFTNGVLTAQTPAT